MVFVWRGGAVADQSGFHRGKPDGGHECGIWHAAPCRPSAKNADKPERRGGQIVTRRVSEDVNIVACCQIKPARRGGGIVARRVREDVSIVACGQIKPGWRCEKIVARSVSKACDLARSLADASRVTEATRPQRGSGWPSALTGPCTLGPKGRHNLGRRREPPVNHHSSPKARRAGTIRSVKACGDGTEDHGIASLWKDAPGWLAGECAGRSKPSSSTCTW